jgi:hypothetical protein
MMCRPFGLLIELEVDGQGKVGGATVEQGPFQETIGLDTTVGSAS